MSEHILVTGGAGYIGSILVPELLAQGYQVTVIDNFMFKQVSLGHVIYHPKFNLVNGDIRNEALMKKHLAKADIVIPLAALVGAPLCQKDPDGAESINLQAPLSLFKWASASQKILMPTTNSAYGSGGTGGWCEETSELRPVSLYAKHKVEVEKALMERGSSLSFRLATVFGVSPRMRLDLLVNDFTYRAFNDRFVVLFESHFRRNYIHVRDVTNAFVHGLKNFESMKNQIYNVGLSEANLSKMQLCQFIKKQVPEFTIMEAPIGEDPDKRDYLVSNAKLEKTGWKPQVGLERGIQELLKGYQMIRNSVHSNV